MTFKETPDCLAFGMALYVKMNKDELSRVYPTSRPMTAGIGSSPLATRPTGIENGWMDEDFASHEDV